MPEEVKKSLIGDLAGLSEPLKKLVEVVSSGVGRFTDAMWFTKRDADNEAYKILKVGGAQTQVVIDRMKAIGAIGSGSNPQVQKLTLTGNEVSAELSDGQQAILALKERSDSRAEYQNLLHQLNIEQTVNFAAEELAQEGTKASEEPVDDDWKARYFNIVQDISSEEMQAMWGKVLAGEIKQPSSFSLRTLDVLKNLSQHEAQIFYKFCNYLIVMRFRKSGNESFFAFKGNKVMNDIIEDAISYGGISALIDCGLVLPQSELRTSISLTNDVHSIIPFQVANKVLVFEGISQRQGALDLNAYVLTAAGKEISQLISVAPPLDYLQEISKEFASVGFIGKYADFAGWSDEWSIKYDGSLVEIPAK